MFRPRSIALALLLVAAASSTVRADPIVLEFRFQTLAYLNFVEIQDADVTIRVRADTDFIQEVGPNIYYTQTTNPVITLAGYGDTVLTPPPGIPTELALNASDSPTGGSLILFIQQLADTQFFNIYSPSLVGYDLRRSFGPIPVEASPWFYRFETTLGTLELDPPTNMTFRATVVPEPASLLALGSGAGLVCLVSAASRCRARSNHPPGA